MKKFNIKESFQSRSFRAGSFSVILTVLVVAIVVLTNMVVHKLPTDITRIDVTFNQIYSISQQTKDVVKNLKEDVTVFWIVKEGGEDDVLEKILADYDKLSPKLHVEKIDPDVNPTFLDRYEDIRVYYTNSLIVQGENRYRFVDYVEDIYVENEHDEYTFAGENALTSAIDYCVSEKLPKMYILTGHNEVELPVSYITQMKLENIDTVLLDLAELDAVPGDADCILISAPEEDISEKEKNMLEQYLNAGGKLLMLTDSPITGNRVNLESLMSPYGVTTVPGFIYEGNKDSYLMYSYNLLPNMGDHPIAKPLLDNKVKVLLSGAQGLRVSESLPGSITVDTILSSSSFAYAKPAYADTDQKEEGDPVGPFALGVAISDSQTGASVIWISASTIVNTTANTQINGGNMDFFLNSVNWLCDPDESGLTIRNKDLSNEYLTISSSQVTVLSVILVGVIPAAYLACGVVFWLRRRRK